ncbi:MAG: hypothetical protein WC437_01740 [Patescibacteria group bacterium]
MKARTEPCHHHYEEVVIMQDIIEGSEKDNGNEWFWIIGTVDDCRVVTARYDLSYFDDQQSVVHGVVAKSLAVRFIDDHTSKIMVFTLENLVPVPSGYFEKDMINTVTYIVTPGGLQVANCHAHYEFDQEQGQDSCLQGIDLTHTYQKKLDK